MINIEFYIPHPLHRVVGSRGTEGVCVGLLLFEEEVIMSVPNAVNCKALTMDNADQGLHEVFVVTQTSGLGGPPCVLPL